MSLLSRFFHVHRRSITRPLLLAGVFISLTACAVVEPYPAAYYADYPGGPYYYYYHPAPAVVVSPPPVGFFFGNIHGHRYYHDRGHFRHH